MDAKSYPSRQREQGRIEPDPKKGAGLCPGHLIMSAPRHSMSQKSSPEIGRGFHSEIRLLKIAPTFFGSMLNCSVRSPLYSG